jgi:hypothetical protein
VLGLGRLDGGQRRLPPMPKPEDFGITSDHWSCHSDSVYPGSINKINAYKEAVKAWERACAGARSLKLSSQSAQSVMD